MGKSAFCERFGAQTDEVLAHHVALSLALDDTRCDTCPQRVFFCLFNVLAASTSDGITVFRYRVTACYPRNTVTLSSRLYLPAVSYDGIVFAIPPPYRHRAVTHVSTCDFL